MRHHVTRRCHPDERLGHHIGRRDYRDKQMILLIWKNSCQGRRTSLLAGVNNCLKKSSSSNKVIASWTDYVIVLRNIILRNGQNITSQKGKENQADIVPCFCCERLPLFVS